MNDRIKSCRAQFVPVFDLPGEEGDGDSGRVAAGRLQHAERNLAGQRLPVRLAFARDDEVAAADAFREMDRIQDRLDAGVHFRAEAHRERGADAAGRAGPGQPFRVDAIRLLPGFRLTAEPPLQFRHALRVRPFLGAEYGRCATRPGEGDVGVVEGVDPDAVRKGSERLQETSSAVHHGRPSEAYPYFFYTLLDSILHQFTCTDG